jgi:glucose/arabinose dehydrogenase
MTICRGCQWSEWEGNLVVGALAGKKAIRIRLRNGAVTEQQILFEELDERIRDVRFGPDGALYILTDNAQGRILKAVPKR